MKASAIIFCFLLLGFGSFAQQPPKWKIGDLQQFIEQTQRPLIVNFWATYCVPCVQEIPHFESMTRKYAKNQLKLLLVSLDLEKDYPDKIEDFLKRRKIQSQVVWLDETDADYFIPKIDSSWSGVLPATLFMAPGMTRPIFFDHALTPKELEAAIQKIIH